MNYPIDARTFTRDKLKFNIEINAEHIPISTVGSKMEKGTGYEVHNESLNLGELEGERYCCRVSLQCK